MLIYQVCYQAQINKIRQIESQLHFCPEYSINIVFFQSYDISLGWPTIFCWIIKINNSINIVFFLSYVISLGWPLCFIEWLKQKNSKCCIFPELWYIFGRALFFRIIEITFLHLTINKLLFCDSNYNRDRNKWKINEILT